MSTAPEPRPLASLPVTVVMNAASGSNDKQNARTRIENALKNSGRSFRILMPDAPGELTKLARRVSDEASHDPQIVVAAGGDGTINTLANVLVHTNVPLGVIPLGTFNYFARHLGISLDTDEAVAQLLDGRLRQVSVAHVNGRVFLINASLGLYRRLQEEREQHKRRFGRNKVVAVISSIASLLRHQRTYQVQLELDDQPLSLRTQMIFFGMNPLQLEKLELPVADCAARGLLAILVLRPMGRWELLGFALRGALQGLGDAENLISYCASRVTVSMRGSRFIKISMDGETIECIQPLRFEALRDALTVVVPREPEPRR